jgi:zinc transporter ZupT
MGDAMSTAASSADLARREPASLLPTWLIAALPLVLLGALLWGLLSRDLRSLVRGPAFPPIEELSITRSVLRPGVIELHVVNGGPDPVTIAQVQVDEAYWNFTQTPSRPLGHLERAVVELPYPWVEGETHHVVLLSRNGVPFEHEIGVAVESPRPSWTYFALFAAIGLLVGVIPVYLGLIWYPVLQRLTSAALDVVLCFTVGLLVFLAVDALHESVEVIGRLPEAYGGVALLVLGVAGSVLLLMGVGQWMRQRAQERGAEFVQMSLAGMIALGIGLHNLGEGLAIGAAFNLGLIAFGGSLIAGFTAHNVTEGLAIVSPLARARPGLNSLLWLGAVAGVPTIAGAWIGGFVYSPLWSLVFLAAGAGAILQVVFEIVRQMAGSDTLRRVLTRLPNLAGLAAGFLVMYGTKLFVAF